MGEWSTNNSVHFAFIIYLLMGLCTFEHGCLCTCMCTFVHIHTQKPGNVAVCMYRSSGNFRVIKFSCFKFSRKNIFVALDTHENV